MDGVRKKHAQKLAKRPSFAGNLATYRRGAAARELLFELTDEEFVDTFSRKSIDSNGRGKKKVRYILCKLEQRLGNPDIHDDTTAATIEHILPENNTPQWELFFPGEAHERYVYRLGNYTLLDGPLNKLAGQHSFPEKLPIYADSDYELTKMK